MRTFRTDARDGCSPEPSIQPSEVATLSDAELASYLSASTYEFDGTSSAVREAVVRLLRRQQTFVDPFQHQNS